MSHPCIRSYTTALLKKSRLPLLGLLLFALSFRFLPFALADSPEPATAYVEDMNRDGRVSIVDVIALMIIGRDTPDDPRADYNGDGAYSITDAMQLLINIAMDKLTPLTTVVEPVETDEFLLNPGRGFISTGCFNDWIRQKDLHPLCSVGQFRWYWDKLEPREGEIDFDMIDAMIDKGRRNSQKIMFRVMCQNGTMKLPQWLIVAGAKGGPTSDGSSWQPDYNNAVFLEKHEQLIKALAERYDGHPYVDHVDIGSVGRWGEWHTSEMPTLVNRQKIVDLYLDNFKKTPLIMLIGGDESLAYAIKNGAGWRADCWGDMGGFSANWNHMDDSYQQSLDAAEANDAWKTGPVIFETCWTMKYWYERRWDIDHILSEALRWHVTGCNNSSEDIPEEWWDKVVEFEKKMGYRFVLKRLEHPSGVKAGDSLALHMVWENKGVAPIYLQHPLAIEFRPVQGDSSRVAETGVDITRWLPGEQDVEATVAVPEDLPPGDYELGIAMLDPHSLEPAIKFAIQGVSSDGWYRLSRVNIR